MAQLDNSHFGPKVTMDNVPWFDLPDQFDQRRIRLASIHGPYTSVTVVGVLPTLPLGLAMVKWS